MRIAAVVVLACVPLHAVADAAAGEQKAQLCLLCHKEGPELHFTPFLEGQPADFLVASITAFKTRQRIQSAMNTNVANLSQTDIRDIADYFSSKPFQYSNESLDPARIAAGERLVGATNCASCHGPAFRGAGTVPRLAGQKQRYLAWQLQAFRGGGRSHPPGMPLPNDQADVENMATYLASLR
jgi:cytochrome c553